MKTATIEPRPEQRDQHGRERSARPVWWREILYVLAFYAVYSFIRNQFGSAAVSPHQAFRNALTVINVERALGLHVEPVVQGWFLANSVFIRAWNVFYGSFHFVVTAAALIWLFLRHPSRYIRWRDTLAFTTAIALAGYALFPLMPPRLLSDFGPFGGRSLEHHFVDTLSSVGGLWSFESGTVQALSNQYAAMPSLHVAWAFWSFFVLYPFLLRRSTRALVAIYPFATIFAIVVTGNHFWLDAAGGVLVLGLGWVLAGALPGLRARFRVPVTTPPASPG